MIDNPNELLLKIKFSKFFTKDITTSGNQLIITIPKKAKKDFNTGDQVLVAKIEEK